MNEAGVMGRFMPEFGRVVALMQFNMYHHYTVTSTPVAIGNLSRMKHGELRQELPLVSDLIRRIRRASALSAVCSMTSPRGARRSLEVGAEWRRSWSPAARPHRRETEKVAWLVRHHLVMSDAAFKRDIDDPRPSRFRREVQSPERLQLLLILTRRYPRRRAEDLERLEGGAAA